MAESYRGLTIRIGGDTTKLQRALRTANEAISQSGVELRKLNQALNLDPGNVDAYNAQLGYMGQQASSVAMKLAQLKQAQQQVAEQVAVAGNEELGIDDLTVGDYADQIENVGIALASVKQTAETAKASLQELHDNLTSFSTQLANIETGRLSDALDLAQGKKSVEEIEASIRSAIDQLPDEVRDGITDVDAEVDRIRAHIESVAEAFSFNGGDIDISAILTVFDELPDHIRPSQDEIDAFVEKAEEIRDGVREATSGAEEEIEGLNEKLKAELSELDESLAKANESTTEQYSKRIQDEIAKLEAKRAERTVSYDAKVKNATTDAQKDKLTDEYNASVTIDESRYRAAVEKIQAEWRAAMEKNASDSAAARDKVTADFEKQKQAATDAASSTVESYEDAFGKAAESVTQLTGAKFSSANGNTDIDYIGAALQSLKNDFVLTQEQASGLEAQLQNLMQVFASNDAEEKTLKLVAQYKDLEVETTKTTAQLRNMASVMSSMEGPSNVAAGMRDLTDNVGVLETAYRNLMNLGRSLESSFKADPTNVNLLDEAMKSYSAATLTAIERAQRLEEELSNYDTAAIDANTDSAKSATEQLYEAREAAKSAKLELAEAQGEYEHWVSLRDKIDATIQKTRDGRQNGEPDEEHDAQRAADYVEATKNAALYGAMLDELTEKERVASEALDFAKSRSEVDEIKSKLAETTADIQKAAEAETKLSQQAAVFDVVGDISDIQSLGTQLDNAVAKAKALSEAAKINPGDIELATAKAQAFADVQDIARARTEAIDAAIAKIDTSKLNAMRDKYGTISNAVVQTGERMKQYNVELDTARSKLSALVSGREFDGIRDDVLDVGTALKSSVIEQLGDSVDEAERLRAKIVDVESALAGAKEEANIAAVLGARDSLTTERAKTSKTASDAYKIDVDEAAFQQAIGRVSQYAQQAGQKIVESANTIDAAYRDMRKTVQGTEEQFASLREEAIKFSQTHVTSADTILEIESLGGQLGVAASALQSFGENVSNLEIATDVTAEDMALKLGQMTNVMSDLNEDTFGNFADSLVRLGNNMAAQESSIINVAQRMSSVANVAQMSTPDLLAWSAAIASTGQRSESAATAISNTIIAISEAVAAGGADLENFASIAGTTSDEFSNAWRTNPTDALKAFINGLQSLSDDNTGAIQALENMGISSVRQETALLGLASTVETLDDALKMSNDAFNGVTDQWGNAGDAAYEAQQKSEGFSGALGKLTNNVSNLAASLGEGLQPFMELLSSVIASVTDGLNSLPAPIKTVIVTIGGLTVALGTLVPLVKTLKDGWAAMIATMQASNMASTISAVTGTTSASLKDLVTLFAQSRAAGLTFSQSLGNVGAQMSGLSGKFVESIAGGQSFGQALSTVTAELGAAGGAASSLGTILSGGILAAGIGVAIAMVGTLVTEMAGAIDRANRLSEAKDRLTTSTNKLASAAKGATEAEEQVSDSVYDVKKGAEDAIETLNELASRQEQLAETITANNTEYETQATLVNEAREAIDQYANTANISRDAQAELVMAVQTLNSELGTTYEVVDVANGIIREQGNEFNATTAEIDAYIDKQLQMAESEAILDSIREATKALTEAENERAEAQAKVDELVAESSDKLTYDEHALNQVTGATKLNTAALTDARKELEGYETSVTDAQTTLDTLKERFRSLTYAVTDSSEEQTQAIADAVSGMEAFNGVFSSQSELERFASQLQSLGATAETFGALTEEQLVVIAQAYNGSVASIQEALSSLGVSFASAISSAGQSAGAVDYTAMAKARKEVLDDYYDSEKSRLDDEYDAYKDYLDDVYDAAKSASTKYLSAYKSALDDEVEAFKEATDAKVALIEEEYDAKQKLLDAEYESRDSAYDDQIAAIEAAQDAEDEAREQAERAEKLASYEEAVRTAKTKKKRAEAEKALSDYKEELAYKDRKAERDAQIAAIKDKKTALKDEYDSRTELLKQSKDDAIAIYKEQREAELEILSDANDAAYEAEKELEDARLESIKDANEAALEETKSANEQYLKDLKDSNEQEVEDIKNGIIKITDEAVEAVETMSDAINGGVTDAAEATQSGATGVVGTLASMFTSVLQDTANTARTLSEQAHSVTTEMLSAMVEKGLITSQQMTDALNGVPGAMEQAFAAANLNVGDSIDAIAQKMYEMGTITKEQYEAIIADIPGATEVVFSDAGMLAAQQLGLMEGIVDGGTAGVVGAATNRLNELPVAFQSAGSDATSKLSSAISSGTVDVGNAANTLANTATDSLNAGTRNAEIIGHNYSVSFANGISAQDAHDAAAAAAANLGATAEVSLRQRLGIFSPSRVAKRLAEYFVKGLTVGLDDGTGDVEASSEGLADAMAGGISFSDIVSVSDPVQDVIDRMRSHEADLAAQTKRMSDIVERGFDPQMTLDAAYEAIDRIDMGRLRREQLIAGSQSVDNSTYAPVININIPEMVVREEADVDRISRQIALRVQRVVNSRVG